MWYQLRGEESAEEDDKHQHRAQPLVAWNPDTPACPIPPPFPWLFKTYDLHKRLGEGEASPAALTAANWDSKAC